MQHYVYFCATGYNDYGSSIMPPEDSISPALNVIKEHFCDVNQALVQMIISIPALFIFLTNIVFPKLCKVFRAKELTLAGLIIYVVGGCAAGLFAIWSHLIKIPAIPKEAVHQES